MRVTNETANRISVLCKKQNETDSCYGCRYDDIKYEFCPATWNAPNLSLDLLDARKIIDEQTALIREMVSELKDIGVTGRNKDNKRRACVCFIV